MKTLKLYALLILMFLFSFTGIALAAEAADPQDGSLDMAKAVYEAFSGGHYAYCAALAVILAVALVKRYLGDRVAWLHSDVGGSAMAMVVAAAGAFATGLATPGAYVTWGLMKSAMLVGIGAAGGFAVLKNLVIEPLQKHLPAWAQPIFSVVFWIFEHGPAAGAKEIAKAEVAGAQAVAAKPAEGAAAATGTPTEVK